MKKDINWYLRYIQRLGYNVVAPKDAPYFLHVLKTGGTYIGQLDSSDTPVLWPIQYLGHTVVVNSTDEFDREFPPAGYSENKYIYSKDLKDKLVFSVVRNPFDWLVSYISFQGGWKKEYAETSHYDYELCKDKNKFDYAVKTILERDDGKWPSKRFMYFQLFDSNAYLVPSWFMRNETLDDDLEFFAKSNGYKYTQKEKQKVGSRSDYRSYYTDELRELLEKAWSRELNMFGYNFDGYEKEHILFNSKLSKEERLEYRYDYRTDNLIMKD